MYKEYSITIIKDKQVIKHMTNSDIDFILDYFKLYNTPDYYVTINEHPSGNPIVFKQEGIQV